MAKKTREVLLKSRQPELDVAAPPGRAPWWIWMLVLVAVLAAGGIRLRLLSMPLERDEGEFAYAGQLILQGVPPYELAYNMKLPGTYAAYAALMAVFGQTVAGIHLGLILVTSATTVLIFLLARRLFDDYVGVAAAATHAIMALTPSMLALSAHATHFVMLAAVGGLLLLIVGIDRGRPLMFLWSGLCLGAAVMMKQPGLAFLALALVFLAWHDIGPPLVQRLSGLVGRIFPKLGGARGPTAEPILWRQFIGRMGLLVVGGALPYGLTCLVLWKAGVFPKFWFWTVTYAMEYGSINSLETGVVWGVQLIPDNIGSSLWLWVIAGAGVVALLPRLRGRGAVPFYIGAGACVVAALLARHYFQQYEAIAQTQRFATQEAADAAVKAGLHLIGVSTKVALAVLAATFLLGLVAAAWDPRIRRRAPLALGLLAFSAAATAAGFYWRNHYFIMMIPAVAILAGVGVLAAVRLVIRTGLPAALRWVPVGLFLAALVYAVAAPGQEPPAGYMARPGTRDILFKLTPDDANRTLYGNNPFVESGPVAEYIEKHSSPTDRLAVLGSEPQIYFLSHRRSATGYIYTYGLMEDQPLAARMQQEMIDEITAARPEYLVWVEVSMSWLWNAKSDPMILEWAKGKGNYVKEGPDLMGKGGYIKDHYELVGLADMQAPDPTVYRWGAAAAPYLAQRLTQLMKSQRPQAPYVVLVYKRIGGPAAPAAAAPAASPIVTTAPAPTESSAATKAGP
jgi:hypothetical protein